jgi:hypothetical protein
VLSPSSFSLLYPLPLPGSPFTWGHDFVLERQHMGSIVLLFGLHLPSGCLVLLIGHWNSSRVIFIYHHGFPWFLLQPLAEYQNDFGFTSTKVNCRKLVCSYHLLGAIRCKIFDDTRSPPTYDFHGGPVIVVPPLPWVLESDLLTLILLGLLPSLLPVFVFIQRCLWRKKYFISWGRFWCVSISVEIGTYLFHINLVFPSTIPIYFRGMQGDWARIFQREKVWVVVSFFFPTWWIWSNNLIHNRVGYLLRWLVSIERKPRIHIFYPFTLLSDSWLSLMSTLGALEIP